MWELDLREMHYCVLVKHLSRLVSSQYNNHKGKIYFCQYCFHGCTSKVVLKSHLIDASYMGHKESSSQKSTTRRGVTKSNLQKQNTNYVYFLSSKQISKAFYVNKTRVSHHHQNPSIRNTSITYHVGAASTWRSVLGNTLNHPKWIWGWRFWKVVGAGPSSSNHL